MALPSPPFVTVEGIHNFRDLGGYPTTSSPARSVRTNLVYRSAEPAQVTEAGIDTLAHLGVKKVYDLRSTPEIERSIAAGRGGIKEWEGAERLFVPVFRDADYSPEGVALRYKAYASSSGTEGFTVAYTDILENAPSAYRAILLHLANEPETPLIIHCTAGKDRTGVVCALILSLCGVADEIIAAEYELTERGLGTEWKQAVIGHLMANPALEGNEVGAWNMLSSKRENMAAFLVAMRAKFGGAEEYAIEKCGLTREDVQKIRGNLVMDTPPLHGRI